MSADYSGLTRNVWPGTWSPSSNAPIALDTELRGSLRTISGATGDRLTDIPGQRLQDGMLVYVQTGYTSGGNTYASGTIYQFKNSGPRDSSGNLSNGDSYWSAFSAGSGSSGVSSFNTRTGAVSLTSGDVTTALGYTPADSTASGASVAPSTLPPQSVGSSNQTGTSAYAARADHIHAAPPASLISGLTTVATSGSYNDLSNKPTIPTTTSQLTNNSGFLTSVPVSSVSGKTGAVVLSASDISGLGGLATLNDAPLDGSQYARKDGAWATISGGSSSFPSSSGLIKITCDAVAGGSVVVEKVYDSSNKKTYLGTASDGIRWVLALDGGWFFLYLPSGASFNPANATSSSWWPAIVKGQSSNSSLQATQATWQRVNYDNNGTLVSNSGSITVADYVYATAPGTTASDGTSTLSARADHVHPAPPVLCPFDPRSSLSFSYDGSGNIATLTYTYGGATQGYADFAYSSGNLSTITYTAANHTTVLRAITFSYSGANISGYTVA